jgi:hypothetical protein
MLWLALCVQCMFRHDLLQRYQGMLIIYQVVMAYVETAVSTDRFYGEDALQCEAWTVFNFSYHTWGFNVCPYSPCMDALRWADPLPKSPTDCL